MQGELGGGRGLTAAVKAGNAGFRIESYGIAFLKFWVPSFFVLNKIERGATLFCNFSAFTDLDLILFLH